MGAGQGQGPEDASVPRRGFRTLCVCTAEREGDGSAQPMVCGLEPKGPRLMFRGMEVCVCGCVCEGKGTEAGRPGDGDREREVRGVNQGLGK